MLAFTDGYFGSGRDRPVGGVVVAVPVDPISSAIATGLASIYGQIRHSQRLTVAHTRTSPRWWLISQTAGQSACRAPWQPGTAVSA